MTLDNAGPGTVHEVTTSTCYLNITGVAKFLMNVTNPSVKNLTIATDGTGSATATFTSDVPALGLTCSLEGTVNFTYNLTSPEDVLSALGSELTQEAPSDPHCVPSGIIEGTFALENADGPVTID